ncbi:MAG: hypothetical protein NTY77_10980 [Elusimicrobia bacterium]|nr:hypothetical protein [Elusimicrobiota bacterium]
MKRSMLLASAFVFAAVLCRAQAPAEGTAALAPVNKRFTDEFKGGKLSDRWEPLQAVGGSYKRFVRIDPGKLAVSVPAGNSWGKTGIMSREPLFTVTEAMAKTPLTLDFALGNDQSTGFCIALSAVKDADVWRQSNVWLHWARKSDEEGVFYFTNTQDRDEDYGAAKTDAKPSRMVTLSVSPETVKVDTAQGQHLTGAFSWLKPGTAVYLYVFSHPAREGGAADLVLHSIRMR